MIGVVPRLDHNKAAISNIIQWSSYTWLSITLCTDALSFTSLGLNWFKSTWLLHRTRFYILSHMIRILLMNAWSPAFGFRSTVLAFGTSNTRRRYAFIGISILEIKYAIHVFECADWLHVFAGSYLWVTCHEGQLLNAFLLICGLFLLLSGFKLSLCFLVAFSLADDAIVEEVVILALFKSHFIMHFFVSFN